MNRIKTENVFALIKTNTVYESIEELDLPDDTDQDILKDENKVIHIVTNQLDWKARTIADLYKRRWDIELFFKVLKQNLQLIKRTISKSIKAFSNFVENIRICLSFNLTLGYVCNQINQEAKRIRLQKQAELISKTDLFS